MITVVFTDNSDYARATGLWQWDYGQRLRIEGLHLPTAVEIHFALTEQSGDAITRAGTTKDGVTEVVIPDSMLEHQAAGSTYEIYSWIYLADKTSGETIKRISMQVKCRPKPKGFDAPGDGEIFRQAIEVVNDAAKRAEEAGDKAIVAGGEAKAAAAQTAEHLQAVQSLAEQVETNVDIVAQNEQAVAGMFSQTQQAALDTALSARAAKLSETAAAQAQAGAETAEDTARQYAEETGTDRQAVSKDKQAVMQMREGAEAAQRAAEEAAGKIEGEITGAGQIAEAVAKDKQAVSQMVTETTQNAQNAAESAQEAERSSTAAKEAQTAAESAEAGAIAAMEEVERDRIEVSEIYKAVEHLRDAMLWSQWFDLHRTGWRGGVTFPRFSQSQSTLGTKTGDNADVVVETSTNEAKGRNDFADKPNTNLMFNGIDVNGYVDENGEPHITAVEGSPEFDRYGGNGDVYRAFLTPFYRRFCTDTEEGWEFADKPQDDMKPWAAAVRPDGTYRSFYFVAKYIGVRDDNGVISSISGHIPARQTISYNTQITEFKKKGTQYCGFTSTDMAWVQWMNDMKFANKNSQATMTGCTSYSTQAPATVEESAAKRIIIEKSKANSLIVGSYVSIGHGKLNGSTVSIDRSAAEIHKYADSVKILKIESYDDNNSAVYVDVDTDFSTETVTLSETLTSPVYLSTMHWRSGSCDNVLGPDGSPGNPKNSKEPFVISGVEMGNGGYIIVSDIIMDGVYDAESDTYKQTPYIVNDSRKISTKITDDYTALSYDVPDTGNAWKYISDVGYDERYPYIGLPTGLLATTSTGYSDGVHTGSRNTAMREVLWFGYLNDGAYAGARCLVLYDGLGNSWWVILPRLSSLRRGVAA